MSVLTFDFLDVFFFLKFYICKLSIMWSDYFVRTLSL